MIKIGNLFDLAKKQLENKKIKITPLMIIDRAIQIRKKLDELEEKKEHKYNHKYYLKIRG